jgi:hypothetical protein
MKTYILVFILLSARLFAQHNNTGLYIEGRVFDYNTGAPLAYASVLNTATGGGSISNDEGFFRVGIRSERDTMVISMIGYHRKILVISPDRKFYMIGLEKNIYGLGQVNITAERFDPYKLLDACRRKRNPVKFTAKAYYELRSFSNNKQIELVECLYNADISHYDIQSLNIKAGRIALRKNSETFFVSLESSRAIVMQKLFMADIYYPQNPLEMSLQKMRKNYRISLAQSYRQEKDSIHVYECFPLDTGGTYFQTKIWVNPITRNILQIDFSCENAATHPFVSIHPGDSIQKVGMFISRKFREENGSMHFSHVDFHYSVIYKNARQTYQVQTKAMLFIYDRKSIFELPRFDFSHQNITDYSKINAIPYNTHIWNNQQMPMNFRAAENNVFYASDSSLTNQTIFSSTDQLPKGLLKFPYWQWSPVRVAYSKLLNEPQSLDYIDRSLKASNYKISIKLLLDINQVQDSLQTNTAAIFDPYDSYYRYQIDNTMLCFFNMFFDLVELERRRLDAEISKAGQDIDRMILAYENSRDRVRSLNHRFFSEVQRGGNSINMYK